ncbi:MAG: hypothetical protein PHT89_04305 [Lachnospiraceae bacterium]|nr:hypothetical protein [Lachnospiraceae bacterium]MDD3659926.1 hypothetical protein [Lachnospiraceae bacterium]
MGGKGNNIKIILLGISTSICMAVVSYFSIGAISGRYSENVNQLFKGTFFQNNKSVDSGLEYAVAVSTTRKGENVVSFGIPSNPHTGTEDMPEGGDEALFKTAVPISNGKLIYDGCVQAGIDIETGELVVNNTEGYIQSVIEDGTKLGAFHETCGAGNYIYYFYGPEDSCNDKEGTVVQMNAETGEKKEIKLTDEMLEFITYDNGKIYVQKGYSTVQIWVIDEETLEFKKIEIPSKEHNFFKVGFIVKNDIVYIPKAEKTYVDGSCDSVRYSIYSYDINSGIGKEELAFGEMVQDLPPFDFETNRMALASTENGFIYSNDTGIYCVDETISNPIMLSDERYSCWRYDSGYVYYKLKDDETYSLYRVRTVDMRRQKLEPFTIEGSYTISPRVFCSNGVMCCYYYEEGQPLSGVRNAQNSLFLISNDEEVSYVLADDFEDRRYFVPKRHYKRYDVKIPWQIVE